MLILAMGLLLPDVGPAGADAPQELAEEPTWSCQSCAARHQAMQALQRARRAARQEACESNVDPAAQTADCGEPPAAAPPPITPVPPTGD